MHPQTQAELADSVFSVTSFPASNMPQNRQKKKEQQNDPHLSRGAVLCKGLCLFGLRGRVELKGGDCPPYVVALPLRDHPLLLFPQFLGLLLQPGLAALEGLQNFLLAIGLVVVQYRTDVVYLINCYS